MSKVPFAFKAGRIQSGDPGGGGALPSPACPAWSGGRQGAPPGGRDLGAFACPPSSWLTAPPSLPEAGGER